MLKTKYLNKTNKSESLNAGRKNKFIYYHKIYLDMRCSMFIVMYSKINVILYIDTGADGGAEQCRELWEGVDAQREAGKKKKFGQRNSN